MLLGVKKVAKKYPTLFATWAVIAQNLSFGLNELNVVGMEYHKKLVKVLEFYTTFRMMMTAEQSDPDCGLLKLAKSSS